MPTSSDLAPFCMPIGSTCCGNTFCVAGESCCGGFCCPAVRLFFLSSFYLPRSSPSEFRLNYKPITSNKAKNKSIHRTQSATSNSQIRAAAPSAPSAPVPPPATTTPRPTAAHPHSSSSSNVVPPPCPSVAISSRAGWAATSAPRAHPRRLRQYRV